MGVLSGAYGPVLQALGITVGGATIAGLAGNCGMVSLVQCARRTRSWASDAAKAPRRSFDVDDLLQELLPRNGVPPGLFRDRLRHVGRFFDPQQLDVLARSDLLILGNLS
jgi:hypothetical protein